MKKKTWNAVATLSVLLLCCQAQAQLSPAKPDATTAGDKEPQRALTEPDVDAWLNSYMAKDLPAYDVAGAAVVVVKDGKILTERGYGYADIAQQRRVDPQTTLFGMGSVSKLFTWTAVMQQVEAGRIDLDADINRYLDFKIPPRKGKPITMRNLMTHTAGFEEHQKRLFVAGPDRVQPLADYIKAWTPERVYAPGEITAYSNYGTALAGYIVQRVSGEPFEDYVDKHIFGPLGMSHSTFREPVPTALRPFVATAYAQASLPPRAFEWLNNAPAGEMRSTGDDMARFMIAELNGGEIDGKRILLPETVEEMHRPQGMPPRPFPGMALGFFPTDWNGRQVTGHDGDLQFQHTVVYLLTQDGVGLFVTMNSAGKDGGAEHIRVNIFHDFMDRYFPARDPSPPLPATATAKAHGAEIAGNYLSSRSGWSDFIFIRAFLNECKVVVNDDGTVSIGGPEVWRETAPYLWTNTTGKSHISAVLRNGHIVGLATEDDPTSMLLRAPWWASKSWGLPLLYATLVALAAVLVLWPAQWLVCRVVGASPTLSTSRSASRTLLHWLVWCSIVAALGAALLYNGLINQYRDITSLDDPLNGRIHLGQLLAAFGVIGAFLALGNLILVWRDRDAKWWSRVTSLATVLASLAFAWFAFTLHLVGASSQF